jgi:hypothetical protein
LGTLAVKWRNYKLHLDGLDRVDGAFEDWSFPRAFNLASDPKERFNIIWQNTWLGDEIGPFAAAYESSVRKYPNWPAVSPTIRFRATAQRMQTQRPAPRESSAS